MILLESLLVALATYSVLPVPQFEWNRQNMKYALCFLPVVGLFCAAGWLGWYAFCRRMEVGSLLYGAVAASLPLLITGGIHMDGFMDTVDALASHQPRERKLEILKDSRCGAFAVLYCGVYLLLFTGLCSELYMAKNASVLAPVFVYSRALSALCALNLPNARRAGMLCAYTQDAQRWTASLWTLLAALLAAGVMTAVSPACGLCAALAGGIWTALYCRMTLHQFGGATGDTAGFFLQCCELACLAGGWIGGMPG